MMYTVHSTLYIAHWPLYTVHCTLHAVHCILFMCTTCSAVARPLWTAVVSGHLKDHRGDSPPVGRGQEGGEGGQGAQHQVARRAGVAVTQAWSGRGTLPAGPSCQWGWQSPGPAPCPWPVPGQEWRQCSSQHHPGGRAGSSARVHCSVAKMVGSLEAMVPQKNCNPETGCKNVNLHLRAKLFVIQS